MNNFVEKFETINYLIGSFDAFIEKSKNLIIHNSACTLEDADIILKSMPTTFRAAIMNKNNEYIGYIGLYNVDSKNKASSIRFEVNRNLSEDDKKEILDEYKKYLNDSLNIKEIEELTYVEKDNIKINKKEIIPNTNIYIPNKLLEPGVSKETLERFSVDYNIPKLQMPFTIKSSDRTIGIIGLSNVIWSNQRANLNIFLDKNLGSDIINELSSYLIDDYINYLHSSNIHNVTLSVGGSNKDLINIIKNTKMNYYGQIPFSHVNDKNIESSLMFQHIPNMEKINGLYIPDRKSVPIFLFDKDKKELNSKIELKDGYKLVSPKIFDRENIDFNKVLDGHINAMKNRDNYTIPLGEDKYILQVGNNNYGIYKALSNYDYVLLDDKNNYCGYINRLRSTAENKNAEIEIAIDPKIQHKGLGTMILNSFYNELFSIGYASITSTVFEFNNPSIKLHDKICEYNGTRIESYYINGKLWDMDFYSKTNDLIENEKKIK